MARAPAADEQRILLFIADDADDYKLVFGLLEAWTSIKDRLQVFDARHLHCERRLFDALFLCGGPDLLVGIPHRHELVSIYTYVFASIILYQLIEVLREPNDPVTSFVKRARDIACAVISKLTCMTTQGRWWSIPSP